MHFFGYSDESKAHKLYNPPNKKVIINRYVQFIEEEAWYGSLEKTINVKACRPHEDKEELTTASNSSTMAPSTPIQAQQGRQQMTQSIFRMQSKKKNGLRKIERHKARLVVKGYKQQHGRDYVETFVSVARIETVYTVVAIVMQHKWKVYQMDIKSTFLNRVLKEEVYVAQPPGYEVEGQEDKVYRLRKALYRLKQASYAWYNRIDAYLLENGFDKCDGEPTLYLKENYGKIFIVVLYVDDLIFTGNDDFLIANFKEVIKSEFEMTDLGLLKYFLGIEVKQIENDIFISQRKYVANILEWFKMHNNKPTPTPTIMGLNLGKEDCSSNVNPTLYKSMIGILLYLITTELDIMYAVSLVSRFMEIPKEMHWQGEKRILRYVNGTKEYGILYFTTNDFKLVGYTDSYWAGSVDDKKSMMGYVFDLDSGAISWASKKKPIVSISTSEVEYVATTIAMCQVVWMRKMLKDLHHDQE
eukprot:PITA_23702